MENTPTGRADDMPTILEILKNYPNSKSVNIGPVAAFGQYTSFFATSQSSAQSCGGCEELVADLASGAPQVSAAPQAPERKAADLQNSYVLNESKNSKRIKHGVIIHES
jgi:hypothetical protein